MQIRGSAGFDDRALMTLSIFLVEFVVALREKGTVPSSGSFPVRDGTPSTLENPNFTETNGVPEVYSQLINLASKYKYVWVCTCVHTYTLTDLHLTFNITNKPLTIW